MRVWRGAGPSCTTPRNRGRGGRAHGPGPNTEGDVGTIDKSLDNVSFAPFRRGCQCGRRASLSSGTPTDRLVLSARRPQVPARRGERCVLESRYCRRGQQGSDPQLRQSPRTAAVDDGRRLGRVAPACDTTPVPSALTLTGIDLGYPSHTACLPTMPTATLDKSSIHCRTGTSVQFKPRVTPPHA